MNNEQLYRRYLVAGYKSWNRRSFENIIKKYPGEWNFVDKKEDLTLEKLNQIKPDRIFFLHWSWKVPDEILDNYECINFHLTDVPYGRGGSPLQNLIVRGHKDTKLSALRMTNEMDAGHVYLKKDLSLDGTAREILTRQSDLSALMIGEIISNNIRPVPQKGEIVLFERRKPKESKIPDDINLEQLYDFIRMLDGEGYPPAFRKSEGFRYEFTDAVLYDDCLEARVTIVPSPDS